MNNVREKLLQYRQNRKENAPEASSSNERNEEILRKHVKEKQLKFYDFWAIDLLNFYPMRKWREFCAAFPLQCWVSTGCVWLAGQIYFAKLEFGLVYFLFSCFLLMFLNLGVRKEDELSAYSVFNENCERLLGQMTSEHFERDLIKRHT